eukprot:1180719-Prorocentrum_minimum.AAC.1
MSAPRSIKLDEHCDIRGGHTNLRGGVRMRGGAAERVVVTPWKRYARHARRSNMHTCADGDKAATRGVRPGIGLRHSSKTRL